MSPIVHRSNAGGKHNAQRKKHRKPADHSPSVVLQLNGKKRKIAPTDLANEECASAIIADCERAKKPACIDLSDLLDLSDADRWTVLDFVAAVPRSEFKINKVAYPNLLDAVIELDVDPDDLLRAINWKMAALESAVLIYPDALDLACNRLLTRMQEIGIKGVKSASLIKQAKQISAQLRNAAAAASIPASAQTVLSVLPDAPVPPQVIVPSGWLLTPDGVSRVGAEDGDPTLAWPVILTERARDSQKNTQAVTIAWPQDGKWQQRVVDRDVAANTRSVVDLAAYGVPVNSNNARLFVDYVTDFEASNLDNLPMSKFCRQLGWQGEPTGSDGFLCGRTLITATAVAQEEAECDSEEETAFEIRRINIVHFRGADEGDDQIADGFRSCGTMEGWLEGIQPVAHYPKVRFGLYASFEPTMLEILDTANSIVSFAGPTTTGKTTSLRIAASPWGDPDEASRRGAAISTWDATAVCRERTSAVLNNVPYILDDTKRARSPQDVAKTMYDVAQGRGRGRGSVKGLARQDTWRTVLLMSGEQPATSFSGDGGTRARVLEMWGAPFGSTDQHTGQVVRSINQAIKLNYGHAGPCFVRYVLAHRSKWPAWKEQYREFLRAYEERAGTDPVASRLADHAAAITMTSILVHDAIELPWPHKNPVDDLWTELTQESAEADRAAVALRHVVGCAQANPHKFFQEAHAGKQPPHDGWWGRWDYHEVHIPGAKSEPLWQWIGFLPHKLTELLVAGGHEYSSTIRTWKDRNWIITTQEKNTVRAQSKARIGDENVWLIKITRPAAVAASAI